MGHSSRKSLKPKILLDFCAQNWRLIMGQSLLSSLRALVWWTQNGAKIAEFVDFSKRDRFFWREWGNKSCRAWLHLQNCFKKYTFQATALTGSRDMKKYRCHFIADLPAVARWKFFYIFFPSTWDPNRAGAIWISAHDLSKKIYLHSCFSQHEFFDAF